MEMVEFYEEVDGGEAEEEDATGESAEADVDDDVVVGEEGRG